MQITVKDFTTICLNGKPARTQHIQDLSARLSWPIIIQSGAPFPNPTSTPTKQKQRPKPYTLGAKGFIKIIQDRLEQDVFEPFILLEDDVSESAWYSPVIDIPDHIPASMDALYLGVCDASAHPSLNTYQKGVSFHPLDNNINIVKIENMLSMHAVLVNSKRWALLIMRAMVATITTGIIWDQYIARQMPFYNVYALRNPILFQDPKLGGNTGTHICLDDHHKSIRAHLPSTICSEYEPCVEYLTNN